ncbi:transposase [Corynebacterium suranareeae]|uniref:Transposase n=1 Tax=Corynebacterium suranareeae TaxID=2506452 RepID=A0A160PND5_9CORY|nr:IS30 family transposase [Corynebacterium suranareeae]BAU94876.1 transposase [Corynebacterium suranareeae]
MTSREQPTTQEAVRRVADGQRVKDVAVDLGIHPSTIYLALKRHGLPVDKTAPHRVLNPQTNRHIPKNTEHPTTTEAVARVKRGERVKNVAKELGIHPSTIYLALKRHNLPVGKNAPHRVLNPQTNRHIPNTTERPATTEAVTRVNRGERVVAVAKELGLHPSTIYTAIKRRKEVTDTPTPPGKKGEGNHRCSDTPAPTTTTTQSRCTTTEVPDSSCCSNDSVSSRTADHVVADFSLVPDTRVKTGRGVRLSSTDRLVIAQGIKEGLSTRQIGTKLGRHHSVIAREINRGSTTYLDPDTQEIKQLVYNPQTAHYHAQQQARRPKERKLDRPGRLRDVVVEYLLRYFSPKRVEQRLLLDYPDDKSMHISHEAIYQSLYVQGRGSLREIIEEELRQRGMNTNKVLIRGGKTRRPRSKIAGLRNRRGWVVGAEITTRPPEADDRRVPGHWEGDLVIGAGGQSALLTLVERSSRFTLLKHLPDDHASSTVVGALQEMIASMPGKFSTITWDQGSEMASARKVIDPAECGIYFCDPHSPWQRPTNENTNGEIRRRFYPKGTDFREVTPEHVAWVQDELNDTPRLVLGAMTPYEKMNEVLTVATTQ